MELVGLLAAGVRGAENGTVEVYARGTSTFSELFTSAEGDGAYTPTAGIDLDENGGVELYVNQSVDGIAFSSTGDVIRRFTQMHAAAAVEVRSQSFTGTDYASGASAASNPAALSALMDLWKTNAGSIDWKVLVGGVSTTLQAAFSSVSGLFFNVRSSTYGATGDGSTDDTSAIQAAIDAASAFPGGIVFFPGGTYRITSTLTVPARVSILGAGSYATNILVDSAAGNGLTYSQSHTFQSQTLKGITILPGQANSAKMVVVESGSKLNIEDCTIGGPLLTGKGLSLANASTDVTCTGCIFSSGGAASYHVYGAATGFTKLIGCRFLWTATNMTTYSVFVRGTGAFVEACVFDLAAVNNAGANGYVLGFGDSVAATVIGSRIVAPAVSTSITTIDQTNVRFFEFGLEVPANVLPAAAFAASGVATNHEGSLHMSREVRQTFAQNDTADVTVPAATVGMFEVRRTTNGAQNANFSPPQAGGHYFALLWNNDHAGGGGTITIVGNVKGLASFTVNANRASLYTFRSIEVSQAGGASTVYYWTLVSTTANFTL